LNCGRGGINCVGCYTGEACEQGTCVARPCNPTTCPTGCCTLDLRCLTNTTVAQCGNMGSDCAPCDKFQFCVEGVCK